MPARRRARRSWRKRRRRRERWRRRLPARGIEAKAFVAMRCWHPFSDGAARAVKDWKPDRIVLLPLYPQYSTTTTASSLKDWARASVGIGVNAADVAGLLLSGECGIHRRAGRIRSRNLGQCQAGCALSAAAVGAWLAGTCHREGRSLSMAGRADRRGPCGRRWGWTGSTGMSATRAGSVRCTGSGRPRMRKSGAPVPRARASSSRRSRLCQNIPKRWSSWISNMPQLARRGWRAGLSARADGWRAA